MAKHHWWKKQHKLNPDLYNNTSLYARPKTGAREIENKEKSSSATENPQYRVTRLKYTLPRNKLMRILQSKKTFDCDDSIIARYWELAMISDAYCEYVVMSNALQMRTAEKRVYIINENCSI